MNRPPPLPRDGALFLDVDGTLLEIAPTPELVCVPSSLPGLLHRVAATRSGAVALVSGRSIAQIDELMHPWRGAVAGLHGAERRRADGVRVSSAVSGAERAAAAALDRARTSLADIMPRWPGVRLEDKGLTLAVHYRSVPAAQPEIRTAVERLMQEGGAALRMIAGKMVIELQPAMHGKGKAIASFLDEPPFRGRSPIFLGDDTTDEDGFEEVNRRSGISIRIGDPARSTVALYGLPSVAAVLTWLSDGH